MFSPADAHIVVCDPGRLPGPEAEVRVADCTRMIGQGGTGGRTPRPPAPGQAEGQRPGGEAGGVAGSGAPRRLRAPAGGPDHRFEVSGLILRVLDAFRPRGATWSGQVTSSPPGPSGGPTKTHLLPGGGVPRVHRARSPFPPRLPSFATPRSVHQFRAVAAGAYPPRRPPNVWSTGAPALPGPCYWLVASDTPLGWRGGCLA